MNETVIKINFEIGWKNLRQTEGLRGIMRPSLKFFIQLYKRLILNVAETFAFQMHSPVLVN